MAALPDPGQLIHPRDGEYSYQEERDRLTKLAAERIEPMVESRRIVAAQGPQPLGFVSSHLGLGRRQ